MIRLTGLAALAALAYGGDFPSIRLATSCLEADRIEAQQMKEAGFEVSGGEGGWRTDYRLAYITNRWGWLSAKVWRKAYTNEGLLSAVYGLTPYVVRLHRREFRSPEEEGGHRNCEIEFEMDWIGYRRSFFVEGYERFVSRGNIERRILGFMRGQAQIEGLLDAGRQAKLDAEVERERLEAIRMAEDDKQRRKEEAERMKAELKAQEKAARELREREKAEKKRLKEEARRREKEAKQGK